MRPFKIAVCPLVLMLPVTALAQIKVPTPNHSGPVKTCTSQKEVEGFPDYDCTSEVQANASITCTSLTGGATSCRVTLRPSGREWHLAEGQSVTNWNDRILQMTCDGKPAGSDGLRCEIQIQPESKSAP